MQPTKNHAARMDAARTQLTVHDAPTGQPGPDQVLIHNHAVAINPVDWVIQVAGNLAYRWLTYPAIVGSDIGGVVVAVGSEVTSFAVCDRVFAHVVGTDKDSNSPAQGAFQLYSVALERMTCPIPDTLSFEQAAVLPLAVSTAACGLFQTDFLDLHRPSPQPEPTDETLLVWGGSTSVGSQAIQLAAAAGYEVITTASPHNIDYVTSLGAAQVFDHHSATVVDDIIAACADKTLAGAIAFGETSGDACVRIVAKCRGKKFVALASPTVSFASLGDVGRGRLATPKLMARLVTGMAGLQLRARTSGVRTKMIYGTTLKSNDVSTAVYRDFLPAALANGSYLAVPKAHVVGDGLERLQQALDTQRRGVSASKIVVTLATTET